MHIKTSRISALFLAGIMLFSSTPVMAASIGSVSSDKTTGYDSTQNAYTSYQDIGEGSSKTNVYLTVDDSNVLAAVPTTIILNGEADSKGNNTGTYSVKASGDISGDKELTIAPESETVTMKQNGKDDITAVISQEKTVFSSEELAKGATSTGSVSASLTAGSWNGSTNFVISLGSNKVPNGYSLLYKYDLSATDTDDVAAYYCVPNKNTEPIETKSQVTAAIKSFFMPMTAYAAESGNVIEHGDTRYYLSDEDTLVISGTGKMKENIQSELIDYSGIRKNTEEHFSDKYPKGTDNGCYNWQWSENDYYPTLFVYNEYGYFHDISATELVKAYINELDKRSYELHTPKDIVIKSGVTNISNKAFYKCTTLESISISDTVVSIDSNAFYNCTNLKSITVPDGVTDIGTYAFCGCKALTDVTIGNGVKTIGSSAFWNCPNIQRVSIGNSISVIASSAFNGCRNLNEITIPKSITEIGSSAFANSGIKNLTIEDGCSLTISNSAFRGCSNLTNAQLGKGISNIGSEAFLECKNLTTINLPDSLTSVGSSAFSKCTSLETITLPEGVTIIKERLFSGCTNLKTVSLPNSVTRIDNYAFSACTNLTDICLGNELTYIGTSAFSNLAPGSVIYCESQNVADLLTANKYSSDKTSVIVDADKFI